jgi:hypothetical protein
MDWPPLAANAINSDEVSRDRALTSPQSGTSAARQTRAPKRWKTSHSNVPAGTRSRRRTARQAFAAARERGSSPRGDGSGTSMGCCPATIAYTRSMVSGRTASPRTRSFTADTIPEPATVTISSHQRPGSDDGSAVARTRRSPFAADRTAYSTQAPGR